MMYGQQTDLNELRRRANANLVKVYDGSHKREEERLRECDRRLKELAKIERKERRERLIQLKRELRDTRKQLEAHEKEWQWLFDKHTNNELSEMGDFGVPDIVVLEEVDATRNNLSEKIVRLEDELWDEEHLRN